MVGSDSREKQNQHTNRSAFDWGFDPPVWLVSHALNTDFNGTHKEELTCALLNSEQKFIEFKVGCFWRFSEVHTIKFF